MFENAECSCKVASRGGAAVDSDAVMREGEKWEEVDSACRSSLVLYIHPSSAFSPVSLRSSSLNPIAQLSAEPNEFPPPSLPLWARVTSVSFLRLLG